MHYVIPGKVLPPPPRKLIIEKFPQLPQPPQDIIVERWLGYGPRIRRVVFHPTPRNQAPVLKNVIVEWESPKVALNRQFNNLGVTLTNPDEYITKYGSSLVDSSAIPEIARGIKPNNGLMLACESVPIVQFTGDVAALSLINKTNDFFTTQHGSSTIIGERKNTPKVVSQSFSSPTELISNVSAFNLNKIPNTKFDTPRAFSTIIEKSVTFLDGSGNAIVPSNDISLQKSQKHIDYLQGNSVNHKQQS